MSETKAYGPPDAAISAVEERLRFHLGEPEYEEAHADLAGDLLDEAYDPALGEQRSVCLADVVAVLQEWRGDRVIVGMDPATYVAERMTGWNGIDAR
jgi:hypothetical protein